jgi:hypothetical protein
MIEMGVEHDRRGFAAPPNEAEEIPGFVGANLVITQLFHFPPNHFRDLALLARHALCLYQTLSEIDTSTDIHHGLPPQPSLRRWVDGKISQPMPECVVFPRYGRLLGRQANTNAIPFNRGSILSS